MSLAPESLLGRTLAKRYELIKLLGAGGMGAVFKARDPGLERDVAVKIILPQASNLPQAIQRFRREARAVARLQHTNIVGVHDFGQDGDLPFLVMEYIDGPPMSEWMGKGPSLAEFLSRVIELLDALAYTHARGVIHRDIKPDNILLADQGDLVQAKLADFGIAALADSNVELTSAGMAIGTPVYMAPEQARGVSAVGPEADLYALGVLLYEFLSGRRPFEGEGVLEVLMAKTSKDPPPLSIRSELGKVPGIDTVVLRAIAREPRKRFPFAAEFRQALLPYTQGSTSPEQRAAQPLQPRRPSPEVPTLAATLGGQAPVDLDDIAHAPTLELDAAPPVLDPTVPEPRTTELVGRESLTALLQAQVSHVTNTRSPRIVVLEGEPGIGKSALAEWLKTTVVETGAMTALSGHYSETPGLPQTGIRGAINMHLGGSTAAAAEVRMRILGILSDSRGTMDPDEAEAVYQLLRPDGRSESEFSDRAVLFSLTERLLRRISARSPLLLVLEDLQWAGEFDLGLIEHLRLGLSLDPAPIYIVLTSRSYGEGSDTETTRTLRRLSRYEGQEIMHLEVPRLTDDEIQEIAAFWCPDDLAACIRIAEQAQGVPLYAQQLARWAASHEGRSDALPHSLQEMMADRVDQFLRRSNDPAESQKMLRMMAVMGERIPLEPLESAADDVSEERLMDELDRAVVEGLVVDEPGTRGDWLRFTHRLLRRSILDALPERRARRFHQRIAKVKEAWLADGGPVTAAELAEHHRHAKDLKAWKRWQMLAVTESLGSGNVSLALEWLEDLNQAGLCTEDSDTLLRGRANYLAGDYPSARTLLEGASFDDPILDAERRLWAMRAQRLLEGDKAVEESAAKLALELKESTSPHGRCLADRVDILLTDLALTAGALQQALTLASEVADRTREEEILVEACRRAAVACTRLARFDEGEAYILRARKHIRQVGPGPKATVAIIAGNLFMQRGDLTAANDAYLRARKDAIRAGLRDEEVNALLGQADVERKQGQLANASKLLARCLTIAEGLGATRPACIATFNQGLVALELRDPLQARICFDKASSLAQESGLSWTEDLLALAWIATESLGRNREKALLLLKQREEAGTNAVVDPDSVYLLEYTADTLGGAEALDLMGEASRLRSTLKMEPSEQ